jgi:hypothetical protein
MRPLRPAKSSLVSAADAMRKHAKKPLLHNLSVKLQARGKKSGVVKNKKDSCVFEVLIK